MTMGRGDFERREAKKPKKALKRPSIMTEYTPPPVVEVIRKKRKEDESTED